MLPVLKAADSVQGPVKRGGECRSAREAASVATHRRLASSARYASFAAASLGSCAAFSRLCMRLRDWSRSAKKPAPLWAPRPSAETAGESRSRQPVGGAASASDAGGGWAEPASLLEARRRRRRAQRGRRRGAAGRRRGSASMLLGAPGAVFERRTVPARASFVQHAGGAQIDAHAGVREPPSAPHFLKFSHACANRRLDSGGILSFIASQAGLSVPPAAPVSCSPQRQHGVTGRRRVPASRHAAEEGGEVGG